METKRLLAQTVTNGIPDKNSFIGLINVEGERREVQLKLQERTCKGYENLHDCCETWGEWVDVPLYADVSIR